MELLPYGIRVNAVVPSEVNTPAYQEWLAMFDDPAGKLATIVRNIPLAKRMTTPAEIAGNVAVSAIAGVGTYDGAACVCRWRVCASGSG